MNMTREPILALLARKPFLPFRLYMTGRYVHEIRDPEYVEVRESVLEIKRPDPSAPGGKSWQCTLALRPRRVDRSADVRRADGGLP